ncbi:MAG: hypothetical protein IT260_17835 [Saprospiraceae bacterium]|nr:hypothetical protein [Saprospiraceae bacterium]
MGTQSSDFHLIVRKRSTPSNPSRPLIDLRQCADAEQDISDGGGQGFMLFILALVVSALAFWLI